MLTARRGQAWVAPVAQEQVRTAGLNEQPNSEGPAAKLLSTSPACSSGRLLGALHVRKPDRRRQEAALPIVQASGRDWRAAWWRHG